MVGVLKDLKNTKKQITLLMSLSNTTFMYARYAIDKMPKVNPKSIFIH